MCGIFGVYINDRESVTKNSFIDDALRFSRFSKVRGQDGMGFLVDLDDRSLVYKDSNNYQKSSSSLRYFLGQHLNEPNSNSKRLGYIGHNRLVTNGRRHLYEDNQPIQLEHVIGFHVGILIPQEGVKKIASSASLKLSDSDSALLFSLIENSDPKKIEDPKYLQHVLGQFKGNYSIAVSGPALPSVILASNCGSLFVYKDRSSNNVAFASEHSFLSGYLERSRFFKPSCSEHILQLENKTQTESIILAQSVLRNQYTAFANKNYEKLLKEFDVDKNQIRQVYKEVEQLNPKPGSSFTNTQEVNAYITADFLLEADNDELNVVLNNSRSKSLRSSQYYKKMLENLEQEKGDKEAIQFLKEKIEGAEWFANALIQREQTLLKTMNCIVSIQEEFFKTGDEKLLQPMKLMDISEKIDLDISTISRVTNSKYIETPYGTFLLKEFFSDAYSKDDGTVISNKVIKSHLQDLLENENKKKPYSDEELSEKLDELGFHIARRTVAKYRDQLGVAVARLRREL